MVITLINLAVLWASTLAFLAASLPALNPPPTSSSLSLELVDTNTLNLTDIITTEDSLTTWPLLPWWTKLQGSTPLAYLDIYSTGLALTPLEAYTLQEAILLPLSSRIQRGPEPADRPLTISNSGIRAAFIPNEHRPPSRDIAAKAIVALAFFEKRFGARVAKGGLRLGMVKVAGIEVEVVDRGVV